MTGIRVHDRELQIVGGCSAVLLVVDDQTVNIAIPEQRSCPVWRSY